MALTPDEQHQENIAQARWRVNFRRSLLEAHKGSPHSGKEWVRQEQQLLDDLEEAMRTLEKLEKRG